MRSTVVCIKIALAAAVVGICAYSVSLVYAQDVASQFLPQDVLSVTTVPSCTNIFGTDTDNAQKATSELCGDAQFAETTIIRLLVGTNDPVGETLKFTAFPPTDPLGGTDFELNMPCKQVEPGASCTTFGEDGLEISYSTSPMAVEYVTKPLTPDSFPMAYLPYVALAYYDVDDESDPNMGGNFVYQSRSSDGTRDLWTYTSEDLFDDDDNNDVICNDQRQIASFSVFPRPDGTGGICACGDCLSMPDQVDPGSTVRCESGFSGGDPVGGLTSCPHCCVGGSGMHSTNGGNYQDSTCPNGNRLGRKSGQLTFTGGRNLIAQAWCQHQAGKQRRADATQYVLTGNDPFSNDKRTGNSVPASGNSITQGSFVNILGPCSQYQNLGCFPSFDSEFDDEDGCKDAELNQGFACNVGGQDYEDDGKTTAGNNNGPDAYFRSAPNIPLRGDFNPDGSPVPFQAGTCVVCPAVYSDSRYMAGLWGNQRKCNTLMEDFLDSYAVQMRIPYLQDRNPTTRKNLPGLGPRTPGGLEAWCVSYPSDPDNDDDHCFYMDQTASREFLSSCDPLTAGDTCWASYNRPQQFVDPTLKSTTKGPSDPSLPSQGVEGTLGNPRGPSMTPWWPGSQTQGATSNPERFGQSPAGGVQFRCGHYCSDLPNGPAPGTANPLLTRDQTNAGYVKGWTQVGPFCRAYEVSLQGRATATVDLTVTATYTNGSRLSQKLVLSTTSVGQGSQVVYSTAGQGVVARINGVKSPLGSTSTLLGGILVTCGTSATTAKGSAPSIVNGRLGPGWSLEQNPWGTLSTILSKVEDISGTDPQKTSGQQTVDTSTGRLPGGCPVPIPPYISALQCFDCSTLCTAPWSVCEAIKQVCADPENADLNCEVPAIFDQGSGAFTCTDPAFDPTSDNNVVECSTPDPGAQDRGGDGQGISDNKAVAWYWLPSENVEAFGTGCGQYGMSASNFGLDAATAQYICQAPGRTTRCVPGVSPDAPSATVPSPCQVIGGMVNFHGKTSKAQVDSRIADVCFEADQLQQPGEADPTAPTDLADVCRQRAALIGLPQGVPYNWQTSLPNWWVHGTSMYTTPNTANEMQIDLSVYVNGQALNAEISSISGGKFVAPRNGSVCTLQKGQDTGAVPIAVNNTGNIDGRYIVTFIGCQGNANDIQPATDQDPLRIQLGPGMSNQNDPEIFNLDVPSSAYYTTAICTFRLSPDGFNSDDVILDQATIGCGIGSLSDILGAGAVGVDDSALQGEGDVVCRSSDLWCRIFRRQNLGFNISDWIIIGLIIAVLMWFIVMLIRAYYAYGRLQTELSRAREMRAQTMEMQSSIRVREQVASQELVDKRAERQSKRTQQALRAFSESVSAAVKQS